ncbi:B12-binding domain/radical SAM domain-containing protein [Anoxybacter fermentans]|uniref:B12-binding domain/radical SAM domain-containing protein n=1 Tax=Anoxybacter fermentans TaxID=1323375 RepID=A0A3Q9HPH0_9FIRM|nr:TIGR04013 family B12-binding domain/radical SAM domain-containing protein [Anoxybacter fermentans]AZR72635.1 B12-binding domain/radical SAM domain-containing protein [Anoxybacter fermentans]
MKYAIVFRWMKNTKYSFVPLIASLEETKYIEEVDLLSIRKIKDLLKFDGKYQELIIAFSFMTFDLEKVLQDLKAIDELGLKTPYSIIAGGPHVSGDPESGKILGFDSIFIGDGEATIRQYCDDLLSGKRKRIYDGTIDPVDLNDYPPFATKRKKLMIPIEITRGCPFGCYYCAVSYLFGRKPRYREIEQILEYSRWAVKHGKVISRFISPNAFGFQSPNGIKPNIEALEKLLVGLKEIGIQECYFGTFPSEVRPESVTPEVLKLVRKYCDNKSLVIGVQSGSEKMLKKMGRRHSLESAEQAINLTREFGLTPMVDFIFGLPGELEEDRKATIAWMEKIRTKYGAIIHAHTFMPLVGSPWANLDPEPLDKGMLKILGQLSQKKELFGYWAKQQQLGEKIKHWREQGFITS